MTEEIQLTNHQQDVLDSIIDGLRTGFSTITVSGYAGTGKTTLAVKLRSEVQKMRVGSNPLRVQRVAFLTLTGKASSVLREKIGGSIYNLDYIGTIHSLIYEPKKEFDGTQWVLVGWKKRKEIDDDLIVVDESSMVDEKMVNDLKSFGVPIVFFGDSFQLPPVGAEEDSWLLKDPDFKLTEVQRHALRNPIINIANQIRKDGNIKPGIYSEKVFKIPWNDEKTKNLFHSINFDSSTIALVAKNKTRVSLNRSIRNRKGFGDILLVPGDRLVCLYNNHSSYLMNGQLGTSLWTMPETKGFRRISLEVDSFKNIYTTVIPTEFLNSERPNITYEDYKGHNKRLKKKKLNLDFFDYGYALTVHKSQGSEWDRVILFEERMGFYSDYFQARWLYTGVTRAINKLFIAY